MTDVPPPPTVMYRIPVEFQVPGTTQRSAATVLAAVLNDTAGVADRLAAYAGVPTAERQAAHPWAFVDRALTGIDTGVRGTLSGLREGTVMPEPAEEPAPQRVHAATIVWSGHPGANPTVVLAETEAMAWHLAALDVVEALTEDGEAFPGAGAFLQQHPETMVYAGRPREWLAALAEATPFPAVAVAAAEVRPTPPNATPQVRRARRWAHRSPHRYRRGRCRPARWHGSYGSGCTPWRRPVIWNRCLRGAICRFPAWADGPPGLRSDRGGGAG